jgi:hypothetical protein
MKGRGKDRGSKSKGEAEGDEGVDVNKMLKGLMGQ